MRFGTSKLATASTKMRSAAEASPGIANLNVMRRRVVSSFAPDMRADSSSVVSMERKMPTNIAKAIGVMCSPCTKIMPGSE